MFDEYGPSNDILCYLWPFSFLCLQTTTSDIGPHVTLARGSRSTVPDDLINQICLCDQGMLKYLTYFWFKSDRQSSHPRFDTTGVQTPMSGSWTKYFLPVTLWPNWNGAHYILKYDLLVINWAVTCPNFSTSDSFVSADSTISCSSNHPWTNVIYILSGIIVKTSTSTYCLQCTFLPCTD